MMYESQIEGDNETKEPFHNGERIPLSIAFSSSVAGKVDMNSAKTIAHFHDCNEKAPLNKDYVDSRNFSAIFLEYLMR
jgi:hypothetical protein